MPRICEFYGIAIYMYYQDHEPAHFHAIYGGDEAVVRVHPFRILRGRLSRRARALVREWTAHHRAELERDWELARAQRPLRQIAPLE